MKMKVQVIVESDDGQTEVIREAIALDRGPLQADQLGLTLAEAKNLLSSVQQTMATCQVQEYAEQCRYCSVCGISRPRKGKHEIVYRTLFGKLKLNSPRYYECSCAGQSQNSKSPLAALLSERASGAGTGLPGGEVSILDVIWINGGAIDRNSAAEESNQHDQRSA